MSSLMQRTAVILLASGLSRRFGRRDKLMADLCGWPMVDHAAGVLASMDTLTRIAVCPADHREIGERLHDRFVIALNKKPKLGLGHSIATGVNVAMQFKPDVVVLAMADMPFIEPELIEGLVEALGRERADIAHCGSGEGARPPTAFDARCFEALLALSGEDGARSLVSSGRFRVHGIEAPEPLLADVDTREDLDLARRQMEIRSRHLGEPVFLAGR